MAIAANDSTLPAITKTPSFVAEESIADMHIPIVDLVEQEIGRKIHLESNPRIVQFEKFTPGLIYSQTVRVRNVSTKIQRTYITNPTTKWFTIKVNKEHNLLPGLELTIVVKFKPDNDKYYFDRMRMSSQSGDSLYIPIHAFPILPSVDFPSRINLQKTAIGEISTYTISLICTSPIELKFNLEFQPQLSCCSITPKNGVLHSGLAFDVLLKFKPEFCGSFRQKLNLNISNIEIEPLTCKIVYLEKTKRDKTKSLTKSNEVTGSTLKSFRLKSMSPSISQKRKELIKQQSEDTEVSTFSTDLNRSFSMSNLINSKQKKERLFIEEQKKIQDEEKISQIKRYIKLGILPISNEERELIWKQRDINWEKFKKRERLVDNDGLIRTKVYYAVQRILLDIEDKPKIYRFSFDMNNQWPSRILILRRFVNAANKVMVQYRANKRLEHFRKFLKQVDVPPKPNETEKKFSMCLDNITPPSASKLFWCPEINKNILWPGLKSATYKPLNFGNLFISKAVPEIKPLLHKILGYKLQDVYEAGNNYIPMAPKAPAHPDCAMERVIAFVEARERFSKRAKDYKQPVPKELFEPHYVMDPKEYFNAHPDVPEIVPLAISSNLEEEYVLYPLNTWQKKEKVDTDRPMEKLAESVLKCQKISIPADIYIDKDETKMVFQSQAPTVKFKLEKSLSNSDISRESKNEQDQTNINNSNRDLLTPAALDATTAPEILTCDNHNHTSSST